MITGFWSPVGGLVFYDTGQVANQASDLDFTRIRHSFGFGLSFGRQKNNRSRSMLA
jgi:outer membrane translocation and assembly module TamA